MEELDTSLSLDLGLNIGFDTDFQTLLENSNVTTSLSNQQQQESSAPSSSSCSKCSMLREHIARLERDHRINFQFLKKKVISTDLLIRRCKAKQDEVDAQAQTVLSLKRQLDNANRDANILSEQLKSAMEDMKPLKEDKTMLESALREKSSEVMNLTDRLHAEEALRHQRSFVSQHNQELEVEKLELERKIKNLQSRNRSLQSNVSGLESDKKSLNMQKSINTKRLNKLALLLDAAQTRVNQMWEQLTEAGATNESIKPKLIPEAVKFLITEALKNKTSLNKKKQDAENGSVEDENTPDGDDNGPKDGVCSGVDNGYEEEDEESDFDDVSDIDCSNESPDMNKLEKTSASRTTKDSGAPNQPEKTSASRTTKDLGTPNKSEKTRASRTPIDLGTSKEEPRVNGISRKSDHLETSGVNDIEGTSPKSRTKKKSSPKKEATLDVAISKLKLATQEKNQKSKKLINVLPGDHSDWTDSEMSDGDTRGTPHSGSSKISPAKHGKSSKLIKQTGALITTVSVSKNDQTQGTPSVNKVQPNGHLRENGIHKENLDKKNIKSNEATLSISQIKREKVEADVSSDESSLCSLHSDNENWLSDKDAGQPSSSNEIQKQKPTVDIKIKEHSSRFKSASDNEPKDIPQQLHPASSSSASNKIQKQKPTVDSKIKKQSGKLKSTSDNEPKDIPPQLHSASSSSSSSSSSSDESEEEDADENCSRGRQSRQSFREDGVAADAGDTVGEADVSLDDIFSFMGNPSPLSPMPPTPSPRSRTVSEASYIDDGSVFSAPHNLERDQITSPLPQDPSTKSPEACSAEENHGNMNTPDCSEIQKGFQGDVSKTQDHSDVRKATVADTEDMETTAVELSKSSSIPALSNTAPADGAVLSKQNGQTVDVTGQVNMSEKLNANANSKKTCGIDTDSRDNDMNRSQEMRKSNPPRVLRQLRTRMSMGFVPSDGFINENRHLCNTGEDGGNEENVKTDRTETYQTGANMESHDQSSSASLVMLNSEKKCEKSAVQNRLSVEVDAHGDTRDVVGHLDTFSLTGEERGSGSDKQTEGLKTSQTQSSETDSVEEKNKLLQSSQAKEPHCITEDTNNALGGSYQVVELYVVKSPPDISVENQPRSNSSPSQIVALDAKKAGDNRNVDEGVSKISKCLSTTPLQRTRRRSSRLSETSENCGQDLSTNEKGKNWRSPEQKKRPIQSPIRSLSVSNMSDGNSAVMRGESDRNVKPSVSDCIIEQRERSTLKQKMLTRSSSNPGNIRDSSTESLALGRTRRSFRLSLEADKGKHQEDKSTCQSIDVPKTDGRHRSASCTELSPGKRSTRQRSAQSKEKGGGSKVEVESSGRVMPAKGTENSELIDCRMIKSEANCSEEEEEMAPIKFSPVNMNASLTMSLKDEPVLSSLDQSQVDLSPAKSLTLIEEKKKTEVEQQTGLRVKENREKFRKARTGIRQKRLSQSENSISEKEGEEEKSSNSKTDDREKGSNRETSAITAQCKLVSALTRRTQMEIAAQQLAKMLTAAKNPSKKKTELEQTRFTPVSRAVNGSGGNKTVQKRGRGRPRKVPQLCEKVRGDGSPSPIVATKPSGEKQGDTDKPSVLTGAKVDTDSDLDTSSLSSDTDDTQKGNAPTRKIGNKVARRLQTTKRGVNNASHKDPELRKTSSYTELQQHMEGTSIPDEVLPTLSSSDSEDESHRQGSEPSSKQHSKIVSPPRTSKVLGVRLARCPDVSALSSSDSGEENEAAGAGKASEQYVGDRKVMIEKSSEKVVQDQQTAIRARPRRGRGRVKMTREEGKKTWEAKTTLIRVDNGNAAMEISDSRSSRRKLHSLNSMHDENDHKLTEEVTSKPSFSNVGISDHAVKSGDRSIAQEPRIKSKEFISSSSDSGDDDDDQDQMVKSSGKENCSEKEETITKASPGLEKFNSSKPKEMDKLEGNGNRDKSNSSAIENQSKGMKRFPHLLSSFVPSQFSAFRAATSPKDKNTLDDEGSPLSEVDNQSQPANWKPVSDRMLDDNCICKLSGKSEGSPTVISADPKGVEKLGNQKDSISMEGKGSVSVKFKDGSSNYDHTEDITTNIAGLDSEEESTQHRIEAEKADGDGVEESLVTCDTTKVSSGNTTAVNDSEGEGELQSEHHSHSTSREIKSVWNTQDVAQKPTDAAKNLDDESSPLPLGHRITGVSKLSQSQKLGDNKLRKRKILPEPPDQPVPSTLETETIRKDLNPCRITLEEIFRFFQVPRCLSPLPRSPSPKKLCRDDEACVNSADGLVQFSAAVPDKCITVTPAASRSHHAQKSGIVSSHGDGPNGKDFGGDDDGTCITYGKAKGAGGATVPVKSGGLNAQDRSRSIPHQPKQGEITSLSLSHQMVQARKLLMARKKNVDVGKQTATSIHPTKKQRKDQNEVSESRPAKKKFVAKLGRFLTPYAAILHDFKEFASKGEDVFAAATQVLTRVSGREVKSVLALLPQLVVEYMDSQKEEDILSEVFAACDKTVGIIETVFASHAELQTAKLISHLTAMAKDSDNTALMGAIWMEVFKEEKTRSQTSVLSYCRLFTLLCMENGDIEQARVLAYNVAKCGYLPLWPCLATIAGVWPRVFTPSPLCSGKPILSVLACMLRSSYQQEPQTLSKACQVMERLCHWDVKEKDEDASQVLKSLRDRLASLADNVTDHSVPDKMFATQKAMELLLIFQGEEWANKHFFQSMLVSVAMRWEFSGGEATGPCPALVISLFKVFRSVLAVLPVTITAAKQLVSQGLSRCLSMKKSQLEVDLVLLESLLDISAYDPLRCSELLRTWQNANPGKVTPHLFSKMQETRFLLASLLKDDKNQEGATSNSVTNVPSVHTAKPPEKGGPRGRQRGGSRRGNGRKKWFRGRGKK